MKQKYKTSTKVGEVASVATIGTRYILLMNGKKLKITLIKLYGITNGYM